MSLTPPPSAWATAELQEVRSTRQSHALHARHVWRRHMPAAAAGALDSLHFPDQPMSDP